MRILHVTHEFPPYEFAGTAIYTWNIVKALSRRHEVFVFSRLADKERADYELIDETPPEGYRLRLMNKPELSWSPFEATYTDPEAERIFCAWLDEIRPDVVHVQHLLGMSHGVLAAIKARGIGLVMTLHDFWAMCPMGQRMCYTDQTLCEDIVYEKCGPCCFGEGWTWSEPDAPREVESPAWNDFYRHRFVATRGVKGRRPRAAAWAAGKTLQTWFGLDARLPAPPSISDNPFARRTRAMMAALDHCDLLITPSAFLRDEFVRIFGIDRRRIIHSPNGMTFDHVVRHPRTASDVVRFGFMGSIIPTKGVHVLVEAARKLDDLSGFTVDVFGAPNQWTKHYDEQVRKAAKGSDHIRFHGRFDNKKVGEVLAGIDVLVVPSIWYENAPLTLNEAAMTRTPVLASDRGGMLEFVRDNGYGKTFRLGDADDLAAKMRDLVENPEKIAALAGREVWIKPVDENATELEAYYERLVAGHELAPVDHEYRVRA